jgi:hypothetical protein
VLPRPSGAGPTEVETMLPRQLKIVGLQLYRRSRGLVLITVITLTTLTVIVVTTITLNKTAITLTVILVTVVTLYHNCHNPYTDAKDPDFPNGVSLSHRHRHRRRHHRCTRGLRDTREYSISFALVRSELCVVMMTLMKHLWRSRCSCRMVPRRRSQLQKLKMRPARYARGPPGRPEAAALPAGPARVPAPPLLNARAH